MSERTYPPMPEPLALVAQFFGEWRETENPAAQPVFTLDQMRAFADAARAMALEEAAQVCDRLIFAMDHGGNLYPRPASAGQCAREIRALLAKEGE